MVCRVRIRMKQGARYWKACMPAQSAKNDTKAGSVFVTSFRQEAGKIKLNLEFQYCIDFL